MYLTVVAIFLYLLNPTSNVPISLAAIDFIWESLKFLADGEKNEGKKP
jgi:hypothetical protein